ncbi:MAG: undecaprenyldiphospho-muramoylpentapeptide beta-N-acetylglucosaminyltransferase [Spirochaetaceae bacterium]|jgi:UDP-N-acetylglucosamine--N-acetylmuramyl-(pentapeptide) pyrophosphoryl-undecaprenol N-acetylglucosamine transferase|nr:undecaprenyldiphospho-muramoylpentapeptide beta-N-acetylglucosaminyltransferase [Spirochaetaceae bacterium]
MIHIAFTGGGSGGHIYPGLAVAAFLQQQGPCRIFWIGSRGGLDRSIVEGGGIEFFGIPAGKFRRYFSFRNFLDVFKVLAGFFAARNILKREKPDLLFSKGGFVSVPPCLAAASLHIPLCTHESDLSPGLATRINARFAQRIFTAYEDTASFLSRGYKNRIRLTGNPIRPEFRKADAVRGRVFLGINGEERILLVLGGSQGAREINDLVRACLAELTKVYIVVHQTGQSTSWDLAPSERYRPYPYFKEEMPQVLAASELVLGRSGAGTIWECAALGRPMVLVPLSGSGTRGDQVENARCFEKAGAAAVLVGEGLSPQALAETVLSIAKNEEKRAAMARASAAIGARDGAASIAREMTVLLEEKKHG